MMWIHEVEIWLAIGSFSAGAATALGVVGVAWALVKFKQRRR